MTIDIRLATLEDAPELLKIYAPYVEETAITFDYDVPSLAEFEKKLSDTLTFYPYLVAEEGGDILGYTYASAFNYRSAYRWSAETSIYLRKDVRGKGVGKLLYNQLECYLTKMGILNVNACIAKTDIEDAYLTHASQKFHEKMGYQVVGCFHKSGYKFNRWYDVVWMEKFLGEHGHTVLPVQSILEVSGDEKAL